MGGVLQWRSQHSIYSLNKTTNVKSDGLTPKFSEFSSEMISFPQTAHSLISLTPFTISLSLFIFHYLSKYNNKASLQFAPQMYAKRAYGRRCVGSVNTDPTPVLCSLILRRIESVFPIYVYC